MLELLEQICVYKAAGLDLCTKKQNAISENERITTIM
jgi:hypothetical protein